MTLDDFRRSLTDAAPPAGSSPAAQALWWAGKADWTRAHECAQSCEGNAECDLVHAYLHRQEGDEANARYWYGRVGRPFPSVSLDEEWAAIATELV